MLRFPSIIRTVRISWIKSEFCFGNAILAPKFFFRLNAPWILPDRFLAYSPWISRDLFARSWTKSSVNNGILVCMQMMTRRKIAPGRIENPTFFPSSRYTDLDGYRKSVNLIPLYSRKFALALSRRSFAWNFVRRATCGRFFRVKGKCALLPFSSRNIVESRSPRATYGEKILLKTQASRNRKLKMLGSGCIKWRFVIARDMSAKRSFKSRTK